MSTASEPNNHEDISPADFVKKIRALGEQRDREDAARFAQLEQDIVKGREERAARRAGSSSGSLWPSQHCTLFTLTNT